MTTPAPTPQPRAVVATQSEASTPACGGTSRPILFSCPMVRAILEGRKTQTRRIRGLEVPNESPADFEIEGYAHISGVMYAQFSGTNVGMGDARCPYGQVGDHLWVRETWREANDQNDRDCIVYEADGAAHLVECDAYKARIAREPLDPPIYSIDEGPRKPSIHMPRWASRLTLEVTSIRVERVQDISEDDARAEGFGLSMEMSPSEAFLDTFYNLNKRAPRDQNPWVWVVSFKRVNATLAAPSAAPRQEAAAR